MTRTSHMRARRASTCRRCLHGINVDDVIIRAGDGWIHATCSHRKKVRA